MAVRDYREMYISTILKLRKNNELYTRSYLADLTLEELRKLAEKVQA